MENRRIIVQNGIGMTLFLLLGGSALSVVIRYGWWEAAIGFSLLAGACLGLWLNRKKETAPAVLPAEKTTTIGKPAPALKAAPSLSAIQNFDAFCASHDISPREADVLRLLLEGLPNKEIAQRLFISESTVKTHLSRLYEKTGFRSRAQLISRSNELFRQV